MNILDHRFFKAAVFALSAVFLAGLSGFAFAGWMENAPGIFMVLVENGLSLCM